MNVISLVFCSFCDKAGSKRDEKIGITIINNLKQYQQKSQQIEDKIIKDP